MAFNLTRKHMREVVMPMLRKSWPRILFAIAIFTLAFYYYVPKYGFERAHLTLLVLIYLTLSFGLADIRKAIEQR